MQLNCNQAVEHKVTCPIASPFTQLKNRFYAAFM